MRRAAQGAWRASKAEDGRGGFRSHPEPLGSPTPSCPSLPSELVSWLLWVLEGVCQAETGPGEPPAVPCITAHPDSLMRATLLCCLRHNPPEPALPSRNPTHHNHPHSQLLSQEACGASVPHPSSPSASAVLCPQSAARIQTRGRKLAPPPCPAGAPCSATLLALLSPFDPLSMPGRKEGSRSPSLPCLMASKDSQPN